MAAQRVYQLRGVTKVWAAAGTAFRLEIPQLSVAAGEKIAVIGVSGCGKSTLLDLLGLALSPSSAGQFNFAPVDGAICAIDAMWAKRQSDGLSDLRKRHIGYVIQTGGLLPFLSVRDNIALSRRMLDLPDDGTVEALAERAGIAQHLGKRPSALSIGERQRVAVIRALAHSPSVIIADEPTAALDPLTATQIMTLLFDLAADVGSTLILASHDWARIDARALRRLHHELGPAAEAGATLSIFGD
jgi:putative ABC transport system ATP-binding protein